MLRVRSGRARTARRRHHHGLVGRREERIAGWASIVGEERLWVSPSCGFAQHTSRDIPVLRAKMQNMVEAAATLCERNTA